MGERINGDVQGELSAIVGAYAFVHIATVVHRERAAQTVFAHDGH
jgi:hypothetical protein